MVISGTEMNRILTGRVIRDAEHKVVGAKNSHMTKFAVAFGSGDKDIVNCTAWFELAISASQLRKKDRVLVAGELKSHDYNGKTYWELEVDFFCKAPEYAEPTVESMETVQDNDIPF